MTSSTRQTFDTPNWFQRKYTAYLAQQNKILLAQVLQSQRLRPAWTPVMIIGVAAAILLYILTLGMLISGIWLIIHNASHFNFFQVILGLLCTGIVWVTRPRFGKWPKAVVLPRDKFPALYELADQVADSLNVSRIDGIIIDEQTNASFAKRGLPQRTLLTIGLPLWEILDDQEKVGLIAHEFAHHFNQDFTRGWLIGSAIHALEQWYILILPPRRQRFIFGNTYYRRAVGAEMLTILFMTGLSYIPLAGLFVMRHLSMQNSKYSEYLADRVASTIAGTDAIVGVLSRLRMTEPLTFLLKRLKTTNKTDVRLMALFRERVRTITPLDLERIRQQEQQASETLLTHPPHSYRLEALHGYPVTAPKVSLSDAQSSRIAAELAPLEGKIQEKLLLDL